MLFFGDQLPGVLHGARRIAAVLELHVVDRRLADPAQRAASPVFFCGMPIAAVGPVAETIRPILTCATAGWQPNASAASSKRTRYGMAISGSDNEEMRMLCPAVRPRKPSWQRELDARRSACTVGVAAVGWYRELLRHGGMR